MEAPYIRCLRVCGGDISDEKYKRLQRVDIQISDSYSYLNFQLKRGEVQTGIIHVVAQFRLDVPVRSWAFTLVV